MSHGGLLVTAVPRVRQHMADKGVAITSRELAELLEVSFGSAQGVFVYMEATDVVQRVKRGRIYYYFLKGVYDETQIEAILRQAGAAEP